MHAAVDIKLTKRKRQENENVRCTLKKFRYSFIGIDTYGQTSGKKSWSLFYWRMEERKDKKCHDGFKESQQAKLRLRKIKFDDDN